jgi:uncharacterized protein involved in exopolysaccharide biosynthesis
MSIIQFLRIFWARRLIVVVAVVSSFLGALVVIQLVQPRYEATARIMLNNLVRSDAITGEVLGMRAPAFIDAQIQMIKDYGVTGRVVDRLGWLSDPAKIAAYSGRPPSDNRDFRRWLAQSVADDTEAAAYGTVLNITYRAPSAEQAKIGAEVLREAFLEESSAVRRKEAGRDAAFYEQQAESARKAAEAAEMKKAEFEKATGLIMQGSNSDLDSERLASLASQASLPTSGAMAAPQSDAAVQLAQLDAQLADASKRLGPNHPEIQELRTRRAILAPIAARQQAASSAMASGASGAAALARALREQKARVIGQRDQVEKLRQLQGEADLRREQYRSAAQRAAQFAVEAGFNDVGMAPLGVVVAPNKPIFPNKRLMAFGSIGLGLGLGLALALLLELLNRRVRGTEDLMLSSEIHCIGVVQPPRTLSRFQRLLRMTLGWSPKPAGAVL